MKFVRYLLCSMSLRQCQLPLKVSNERKQLPAHSVSIEIYRTVSLRQHGFLVYRLCVPGASKGTPGDANWVTEILGEQ